MIKAIVRSNTIMSFTGNIAPAEVIEVMQERLMERGVVGAKGRPIVLARSILEPIDLEARQRAMEGRETVRTADQWIKKVVKTKQGKESLEVTRLETARDICGDGGQAYTAHTPKIAWKQFPILYHVDASSAPVTDKAVVEAAIDKAFNTYNAVYRVIKKNDTVIMFKRTMDPALAKVKARWQYLDGALRNLGRCYYSWWVKQPVGELKSASINFDTADKWFTSAVERCGYSGLYFDIQNVAAHEIGHACGLAHNTVDPYSTMYPTSKCGETLRRSLGAADIKALTDLYQGG
jgi:Matrixin